MAGVEHQRVAILIERAATRTAARAWRAFEAAAMLSELQAAAEGRPGHSNASAALVKRKVAMARRAEKLIFNSELQYALAAEVRLNGL